jgi:hypothetical protein
MEFIPSNVRPFTYTAYSIVAVISNREYFNTTIAKKLEILEEDWDKCEVLGKLLKSLQLATTILYSEQKITISIVNI